MLRNEVRLTIFDNLLDTNDVNDTEHNPVDSRIANDGCADVYGKLKNCYARFLVREKCDWETNAGGRLAIGNVTAHAANIGSVSARSHMCFWP